MAVRDVITFHSWCQGKKEKVQRRKRKSEEKERKRERIGRKERIGGKDNRKVATQKSEERHGALL